MNDADPSVLFVCQKNGGKSQMAAALMRLHYGDQVSVWSAGTAPAGELNQLSVQSVIEVGADIDGEYPKPIDSAVLRTVDRVVVLGEEAIVTPVPDMRATIDTWVIAEPSLRGIEGETRMRMIRDEIDARVRELGRSLGLHVAREQS